MPYEEDQNTTEEEENEAWAEHYWDTHEDEDSNDDWVEDNWR